MKLNSQTITLCGLQLIHSFINIFVCLLLGCNLRSIGAVFIFFIFFIIFSFIIFSFYHIQAFLHKAVILFVSAIRHINSRLGEIKDVVPLERFLVLPETDWVTTDVKIYTRLISIQFSYHQIYQHHHLTSPNQRRFPLQRGSQL